MPAADQLLSRVQPLFICTIEPEYPQLIGACMQFLSLRMFSPEPAYLLRIVEGDVAANSHIAALARVAGIPCQSISRHPSNRFLNKWMGLTRGSPGESLVVLVDWDILNSDATTLPKLSFSTLRARPNPQDIFSRFAARIRRLHPGLWQEDTLPCSINTGIILITADAMAALSLRILEIERSLRDLLPEAGDWQLEKLAASLAAGETGWEALPPEWNVTPLSEVSDDRVLMWHYNNGHEATRELKLLLHRPEQVEDILSRLRGRWPRQCDRFQWRLAEALSRLRLSPLLQNRSQVRSQPPAQPEAAPLPTKRYLLLSCSSGLCNRMLALAGALRMATLTNRELFLYWPNNAELGCGFNDLFANRLRMFTQADVDYLLATHVTVKLYNAWRTHGPHYPDLAGDGDPHAEIVLVKSWYYPKFCHEVYDGAFYRSARLYLNSLRVRPEIVETADRFPLPELSLGVHLRRADQFPEFQVSKDEHFEKIMDALLDEFPKLQFFLATDDSATEAKFRRRFGASILVYPKTGGGRSQADGMKEAFVDLLLLSRTRAILGNHFSTFSHTAAAIGGKLLKPATAETAGRDFQLTLAAYRDVIAEEPPEVQR